MKRDRLLGRPITSDGLDRIIGVRDTPTSDDPLARELERLSFELPQAARTVEGVRLTAAQYSRWLELKGQIVRKEDTGLTLEETLSVLIGLPEYQALGRRGRIDAIRTELHGFSRLATDALLREDKRFAYQGIRKDTFRRLETQGYSRDHQEAEMARLAAQLGLVPNDEE